MSTDFCLHPDNADAIARKEVKQAYAFVQLINAPVSRLDRGRDEYRLSSADLDKMRRVERWLAESHADAVRIVQAQEAATIEARPVLQAAE
jgi:hypothetical protein